MLCRCRLLFSYNGFCHSNNGVGEDAVAAYGVASCFYNCNYGVNSCAVCFVSSLLCVAAGEHGSAESYSQHKN